MTPEHDTRRVPLVTSKSGPGAAASGVAVSPARPAQSPGEVAVRDLLVQRAMSLHFVLAQDHIDKLLEEGHTDAALIELEGLREAARVLDRRIASTIAAMMMGAR